ncbi:MAG: Gldg family protein [Gemmatimonadota bacterium]|nr:MAG: Gldg family protein [Gemmatimonadota bacterium]
MMKPVWTLARRELRFLFDHPTGYILLVVFLGFNNFLFFRTAYLQNLATLRPMLGLLPWILLFFAPAVTMRTLSEDARSGTLEVVLAQPITEVELVLGKYLGALLFGCMALLLTVTIPLGLSLGADLQVGVMLAQYVGAVLLAAAFTGVGLWASSVTPNQITAFIVGVAVMFLLILAGAGPMITGLPPRLAQLVASLAVLPHFENIARGVIDLRDAVYFLSVAGLFLTLAYYGVMRRKLSPVRATRRRLQLGTVLIAALVSVVNLLGGHIGGRLDLTPGKAYTLSPATKEILGDLEDLVTVKLFVTQELPEDFGIIKRDIGDLLADFRSAGDGNLRVLELDPAEDEEAMAEARALGIPPVQFSSVGEAQLQLRQGYLGIAVQYADAAETIPVVTRTDDLEYRLISFIRTLTRPVRTVVGLVESRADPGQGNTYGAVRQQLERTYDVRTVPAADSLPIAAEIEVLVLAGPPPVLDSAQLERFAAFLSRGGGALVLASGMRVQPQGLQAAAQPLAWNAVLEPYGVSVRPDMVYDLASNEAVSVPTSFGRMPISYPFWIRALSTQAISVNADLEAMVLPWTSSIDTAGAAPGTVVPLFVTSRAAGVEEGRALIAPQRDFPQDDLSERVLAALVNPQAAGREEGPSLGRVVLVGNSEFVTDRYVQTTPTGMLFVLNAVDWLAQDDALIQIRSKNRRPPALVFEGETPRRVVKYLNMVGMPLLIIAFAVAWLWRRRRWTRQHYGPIGGVA